MAAALRACSGQAKDTLVFPMIHYKEGFQLSETRTACKEKRNGVRMRGYASVKREKRWPHLLDRESGGEVLRAFHDGGKHGVTSWCHGIRWLWR